MRSDTKSGDLTMNRSPNAESNGKEVRRIRQGIRRSLSMVSSGKDSDWDDSPFLTTIGNRTVQAPILAFKPKRMLLETKDENESPANFSLSFKRPEAIQRTPCSVQNKRSRSLFPKNMNVMNIAASTSKAEPKCNAELELSIMKAVQKADQDANLIGDFSKSYALPLIANSKHQDLKTITSETLAAVIKGEFNELLVKYTIVDCRYPYEYEGGHIIGAKNIYSQDQILSEFFNDKVRDEPKVVDKNAKRNVIIFHCEFSSERGPSLYRYLRSKDRELNTYPNLHHPEVYLLNGGYKAFFESFKELCVPQTYLPMLSKDHKQHLRQFRHKSKSWNCENKYAAIALF
ncbi:M-phase inducer phosphatase 1-B-like protein [Leptotrombidium deliense]|uniref:M-phase inducer phosphatase n=1 Tax=Leptotrombidium deliense TaxID=299467 RepID=A0A443SBS7_9ACAR|nr:M-phase inducer phosphatase 1-B-like protein [Leptotrombidium deliense]